jgi:UDP-N-acetylglucosamine transferase subunit ALG13
LTATLATPIERPLVFVTVGTDSYRFDRLVEWADSWFTDDVALRARCFVQHGTARAPRRVPSQPFLGYPQMTELIDRAAVVVSHAGPATIRACADRGRKPIVVARLPQLSEIVDDHQVRFARRLVATGEIELAESELALHDRIEHLLAHPAAAVSVAGMDQAIGAVARFEELVGDLMARRKDPRLRGVLVGDRQPT